MHIHHVFKMLAVSCKSRPVGLFSGDFSVRATCFFVLLLCIILLLSQPAGSNCFDCTRKHDGTEECMKPDAGTAKPCPPEEDRCVSLQVFHKGQRKNQNDPKDKDVRFNAREERKSCFGGKRDKCAQDHLPGLEVNGDKCVKGDYPIEDFEKYEVCTGDGIEVNKVTGHDGQFWGEYGNVQYVEIRICSCKANGAEPCNKHDQGQLDKAEVVAKAKEFVGDGGDPVKISLELFGFLIIFIWVWSIQL